MTATGRRDDRRVAGRLTARDRWIIAAVAEHTVLTTDQLTALAFDADRRTRRRMTVLHQLGVVDRFRPISRIGSRPWHYVLAPAGHRLLTATFGAELPRLRPGRAHTRAVERSATLAHTVGVNDVYAGFSNAARHGHIGLVRWWPERTCQQWWAPTIRPDAYVRATTGAGVVDAFVEYDTGTEPLHVVTAKTTGYRQLARSTGIPATVLFVFPTAGRERNVHAYLPASTVELTIATTTHTDVTTDAAGPIWHITGTPPHDRDALSEFRCAAVVSGQVTHQRRSDPVQAWPPAPLPPRT